MATTYYISPTGNDSTGTGTSGSPWLTISKAYTSSISGDTILCQAGTYTWVNQTFSSGRIISSVSGATATTFNGGGANVQWQFNGGNSTISNLTFTNAAIPGSGNTIFSSIAAGQGPTFIGCVFSNLIATASYAGALGNLIVSANSTIALVGCLIWNFTTAGSGNVGFFATNSVVATSCTNCTFYSNLAAANTFNFTMNFGTAGTFLLKNNIFVNDNGTPQTWDATGGATFTGSTNNNIRGYTSLPSMTNTTTTDPLFVNPAGGNFNLRPTSPAIGVGIVI